MSSLASMFGAAPVETASEEKPPETQVTIGIEAVGAGGLTYRGFSLVQNGKSESQPLKFRISDENGKEVSSGEMEYG